MKILNSVQQGTEEWIELRRNKITATDCAAILEKSRYKSPRMVWMDKMGRLEVYENEAMKKGKELESEARIFFNEKFKCDFRPIIAVSDDRPWQMASLDGYDFERNWILEIKCPGEKVFREVQSGDEPSEYILQCLHQLSVAEEASQALLCFYFKGDLAIETFEIGILRDLDAIDDLNEKEWHFYRNHVIPFKEPPMTRMDYQEREDAGWERTCSLWKEAKTRLKEAEEAESSLREEIILMSGGHSSRGAGVQLTNYLRQGSVDYAKIPMLKGVDLDPYRKPPIESWRITEI